MLDKDLVTLKNLVAEIPLEGLEDGVWRRVAADGELARMRRLILACQAGVLAVVIAGGAMGGLAFRAQAPAALDAFSLEGLPAPSTLLLGHAT